MVKDDYVFGNQKLEWSYRFDHFAGDPVITNDGLKILIKVN